MVVKQFLFANPDFTDAVGKGRPHMDPHAAQDGQHPAATAHTFWGSPAFVTINNWFQQRMGKRLLEDRKNSPYAIFVDFFQSFTGKSYSTGAVLLRCEDMTLEDRGRMDFTPVIMIIPGPTKPQFAAPYMQLIAADFQKWSLGDRGIWVENAVRRGQDGKLVRASPFHHHPVLVGLDADIPAGQWVLEAMQSSQGHLACFKCKMCGKKVIDDSTSLLQALQQICVPFLLGTCTSFHYPGALIC